MKSVIAFVGSARKHGVTHRATRHVYYRDRGWFDADYYYPTRLGPLKRAAGAAFDRIAARSSRSRAVCRAQAPAHRPRE